MTRFRFVALLTLVAAGAAGAAGCATTSNSPAPTPAPAPAPVAAEAGDPATYIPKLEPYTCEGMERVQSFGSIFLASQPADAALEKASKNGIRTVINLREVSENGESERALVERLGMDYVNVPVSVELLDDSIVDRVRAVLDDPARHPVMIHCSSGNRVGMVWAAVRATKDGLPLEAAIVEGKIVGMKTPAFETFVRDFVSRRGVK